MNLEEVCIIAISNGCSAVYPENTLTKFKNKLPASFLWRKNGVYRYHIAIEAIGLSTNFTTTRLPIKQENPSLVMALPLKWPKELINLPEIKDNPVPIQSSCFGIDTMPTTCNTTNLNAFYDPILNMVQGSYGFNYFFNEYENMSIDKYVKFFKNVVDQSNGNLTFNYNQKEATIEIASVGKFSDGNSALSGMHSVTHLFFHSSLLKNIELILNSQEMPFEPTFMEYRRYMSMYNWDYTINGEEYYRVFLHQKFQSIKLNLENVNKKHYPNIIKVQCEQIKSQIFDSFHSKDILIFHPEIPNDDTFFFHEVENKQFLPLENTILDNLEFKLVDENDKQINLNEGIATIIKLRLKKMSYYKKSFTVRLTSRANKLYPNNKSSEFTVNLPQNLIFDDSWKVSVSNINLPNKFATLPAGNYFQFVYKDGNKKKRVLMEIPTLDFTREQFLSHINSYFDQMSEGKKLIHFKEELQQGAYEKTVTIQIFVESSILHITKDLAVILGYGAEDFTFKNDIYYKPYVINTFKSGKTSEDIIMSVPMNLNYFQPSYAMLYTDIVKPTIIGGEYANILKIFPIFKNSDNYIIHQFKDPEHYSLQNKEIKTISLVFKNHAGETLNFASKNIVIVDLTFSNYV